MNVTLVELMEDLVLVVDNAAKGAGLVATFLLESRLTCKAYNCQ